MTNIARTLRHALNYALCIVNCALLASCNTDELCYLHPHAGNVEVQFDWSEAPDADPQSMAAYFYDVQAENPFVRYDFAGRNGGSIDLTVGRYHAIGLNSDHYRWSRILNEDDPDNFMLTTDNVEKLAMLGLDIRELPPVRAAEQQRVAKAPEGMIWSHRPEEISIDGGSQTVIFTPKQVTCRYSVLVTDVENIKYLHGSQIDGTISGMSEGFMHGQHSAAPGQVTMPFLLDPDESENTLRSEFLTFGRPDENAEHILTIYVMFDDGSARYYTYDVTDQVAAAPDPFNVVIVINGIWLPKPIVNGGGFHPTVKEWEEVIEDIKM